MSASMLRDAPDTGRLEIRSIAPGPMSTMLAAAYDRHHAIELSGVLWQVVGVSRDVNSVNIVETWTLFEVAA